MRPVEIRVGERTVEPRSDGTWHWIEHGAGVGAIWTDGGKATVLVEGGPRDWVVTLRGRRIGVTVRSWRDRILADAAVGAHRPHGPAEVRATLPGLVLSVAVAHGTEVSEGDPLLTVEAMKMQNEIRAPRSGRVVAVEAQPGQTVSAGAVLIRLE